MKTGTLLKFFTLLSLVTAPIYAADFYVRSGASGSNNGTSWTNAWSELNKIVWSNVNAGDTIWLAGGSYSTTMYVGAGGTPNSPSYNKSGTSSTPIYVKRVLATDTTPVAAAGWNASYDSQVVLTSGGFSWGSGVNGTGSYVTIDGRLDTGTSCGIKCNGVSMDTGNSGVVIQYVDMAGPAGSAPYTFSADEVAFYAVIFSGRGTINSPTVSRCRMHGVPNAMKISVNGIVIKNSKLYDVNVYNFATYHGNIVYTVNSTGTCIFQGNEIWNWDSEGIMLKGSGQVWQVSENLFRDAVGGNTTGVGRAFEVEDGAHTVYFYNNTMNNIWLGLNATDGGSFTSASQSRNNIYWKCQTNGDNAIADTDYNFTDKSSISGSHSIAGGSNPFVSTTDRHILATLGAKFPIDKGVSLSATYARDFDGQSRPQGGAWDIGAFEYLSGTATVTAPSNALIAVQLN